ncbi:MAG: Zn-dependent alcohol dehydrogenase [Ilumatobacteraceae bacterium]
MTIDTRAAVLTAQSAPMHLNLVRLPDLGRRSVHVRMHAMGVCHSDLSLADGTLRQPVPAVLGHEGSGIVVATGPDVGDVQPGDNVILNWAPACGACHFCLVDEEHLCIHAADRASAPYAQLGDGTPLYAGLGTAAFAADVVLDERAVLKIPDDISLDVAGLIGCAVFTGVGAVLNSARVRPGESVAVVGLGGIGLCAVQGARIAGAHPIIAIDVNSDKAALATDLGAHHFVDGSRDTAQQVRAHTDGLGTDHVIECVGLAATIRQSWSMARRGGRVTVLGIGRHDEKVEFSPIELFHFARTMTGCVFGDSNPRRDLPRIVNFLRSGALRLEPLVSRRIGLEHVDDAFEHMRAGDGARSLIVM